MERKKKRETHLPRFMVQTESTIPSVLSRFQVELHTENNKVVDDLHQIEDFVDVLGVGTLQSKKNHGYDKPKNT